MTPDWILAIIGSVPDFGFALIMVWLCQLNGDRQRIAYQEQIKELYAMLGSMLTAVSRSLDLIQERQRLRDEKSKQN